MKKIIFIAFIIFAISCLTWADENQITNALKQFKIIPEYISGDVPQLLKITYENGISVDMGNKIMPYEARNQPAVEWDADESAYYTLITTDIDAPFRNNSYLREANTWLVGNIPGDDINSGEVLVAYVPTPPPRGDDFHRALFTLFKQPRKLDFNRKYIDENTSAGRTKFSTKDFAKEYNLDLVAANFYLTHFEPYVLKIYKQLNCCFEYNQPEE